MSRMHYPAPLATSPELVVVRFAFTINGTSNPNLLIPGNPGIATGGIVRTGTGVFTVTFETRYPVLIGVMGSVMGPAAGSAVNDQFVKTTADGYVPSTGVLTLTVVDSGTATAADPTTASVVYCEVTFCRRSGLAPTVAI